MSHSRHCPNCNREWLNVPDHVIELFHQCPNGGPDGSGRRRIATIPNREEHREQLFHALLAAQGPESIWRPLGDRP